MSEPKVQKESDGMARPTDDHPHWAYVILGKINDEAVLEEMARQADLVIAGRAQSMAHIQDRAATLMAWVAAILAGLAAFSPSLSPNVAISIGLGVCATGFMAAGIAFALVQMSKDRTLPGVEAMHQLDLIQDGFAESDSLGYWRNRITVAATATEQQRSEIGQLQQLINRGILFLALAPIAGSIAAAAVALCLRPLMALAV